MPSLSSGVSIAGASGGVSALVKSAGTLSYDIGEANDLAQSNLYANDHSDSGLAQYQTYLKGRIAQLSAMGTGQAILHTQTLIDEYNNAVKSNISFDIQTENIQIQNSSATDSDKLTLINQEYSRAVANGDYNTAQSLLSQADTLSQKIQYDAQAATAATASAAGKSASAQNNVATQIEDSFKSLNQSTAYGGMADLNKTLKTWVANNKTQLEQVANGPGISTDQKNAILKAINSSQPNYIDITNGVINAMAGAHFQAALMENPYDPQTAQGYADTGNNIMNGSTKVDTLAGSMSALDALNWQQNPAMFSPHETVVGGQLRFSFENASLSSGQSTIKGLTFNAQGQVVAQYSGSDIGTKLTSQQANQINTELKALGVTYNQVSSSTTVSNGIEVQITKDSPKWLQNLESGVQGVQTSVYLTPQGLQVGFLDANGKGHIYALAKDSNGNYAAYEGTQASTQNGGLVYKKQVAAGDKGFNQQSNSLVGVQPSKVSVAEYVLPESNNIFKGIFKGEQYGVKVQGDLIKIGESIGNKLASVFDNRVSPDDLVGAAFTTQQDMMQKMATAQMNVKMNLPALSPIQLPKSNPTITAPPLSIQNTISGAGLQPTVNPQPNTVNPQKNNVSPQGGTYNPQQGSTKVANLSVTSGTGIKL